MPDFPSGALLGAFVASILAACSLPTISRAPSNDPAPSERKPDHDFRRPEIIGAELLTGDHLRLRFSEPLAAVDGVDPNDFRLSSNGVWSYPSFLDLGLFSHDVLIRLADMTGRADTLDIHLEPDFDLEWCGGLFLHYSPGERPITDEAGNKLAGFGAKWVRLGRRGGHDASSMHFEGPRARRALHGLIPVECRPAPVEA